MLREVAFNIKTISLTSGKYLIKENNGLALLKLFKSGDDSFKSTLP